MNIEANGLSFNYRIEGAEGAPWVTFSNSLACDLSMWDGQVAALRHDYRILRYDTRGHGGTDAPEASCKLETCMDWGRIWGQVSLETTSNHICGTVWLLPNSNLASFATLQLRGVRLPLP